MLHLQTHLRAIASYSQDLTRHAFVFSLSVPMSAANATLASLSHTPEHQRQQGVRLACACILQEPFAEEGSGLPPLGPKVLTFALTLIGMHVFLMCNWLAFWRAMPK